MTEINTLSQSVSNLEAPLHLFIPGEKGIEYRHVQWKEGAPLVSTPILLDTFSSPFRKGEGDKTILIIPKRIIMARALSLASTNEEELHRILDIRSLKLFPLTKEERWIHFEVLEYTAEGYTSLMLYCVQKSKIQTLLAPLLEKGIVPDQMWIGPSMLTRFLHSKFPSEDIFRFAYRAPQEVEFGTGKKDALLFSRSLASKTLDTGTGTEGEDIAQEMSRTWNLTDRNLRVHSASNCYWISEEGAQTLPSTASTKDTQESGQASGTGWIPVTMSWKDCLLSWRNKPWPPFLIPKVEAHKKKQQKKIPKLRFMFLIILAVLVWVGALKFENSLLSQRYVALTDSIHTIKRDAELILTLKEQLEFASSQYSASEKLARALQELCQIMPEGTSLTLFQTKGTRELLLKGVSKSGLLDMVEKLEKSPVFKNVSLKSQNKSSRDQGIEFYILCALEEF